MAFALTLDQTEAQRISRDVAIITGSIALGTTATAGVSCETASASGKVPAGRKIGDFFETLYSVHLTWDQTAAHITDHYDFIYDTTNDKLLAYVEAGADPEFEASNSVDISAGGSVKFVAFGSPNVSP